MTIVQILILAGLAAFWGLVVRNRGRSTFLLIGSVIVIFWLQPVLPLRGFGFWLPLATLALTILTWFITAPPETRRDRANVGAGGLVLATVAVLESTRFFPIDSSYLVPTTIPVDHFLEGLLAFALAYFLLIYLQRFDRALLAGAIIVLIGVFAVLKIPALAAWVSLNLRTLTAEGTAQAQATDLRWLGFSYIAFRLIHTLRDRQSGRLPAVNLGEFITYVIFFPSISAGPIDRLERFVPDLRRPLALTEEDVLFAGRRLMVGLFKKFVVADSLALIALNDVNALQVRTGGWMWVLLYAYAFQIYYDFSGYTDIAIGIARFVGIALPENFSAPYLKADITQFWNNWHMTLTQWFRAYFFNPVTRWLRSWERPLPVPVMIFMTQLSTMVLIGFWHGVTWNFALWGAWHGLGLFAHNRWSDLTRARTAAWATTPWRLGVLNVGGIVLTFHFVAVGWVFFALSTPATSLHVLARLFGLR